MSYLQHCHVYHHYKTLHYCCYQKLLENPDCHVLVTTELPGCDSKHPVQANYQLHIRLHSFLIYVPD